MKRFVGPSVLAAAAVVLSSGCSSPVADEISRYSPAEVQALRDQAQVVGMEVDDENLLSFLDFRQSCRDVRSGLDSLEAGGPVDAVADELEVLLVVGTAERQPAMSEYFTEVLGSVRDGDPSDLREFYANSCTGVV